MKVKKYFIGLISMVLLSLPAAAAGQEALTILAGYNAAEGSVTYSGSGNGVVTFITVQDATDLENATAVAADPYLDISNLSVQGSFSYSFSQVSGSPYGVYKVRATDDTGSTITSFITYDKANADSIVSAYLNQKSQTEFLTNAVQYAADLGILITDPDYSSSIFTRMHQVKTAYADSTEFYNDYQLMKAVCAIEGKDSNTVQAKLRQYESVLNISFADDFEKNSLLNSSEKNQLLQKLSASSYTAAYAKAEEITGLSGFAAYYNAICAVVKMNGAEDSVTAQAIYTQSFPFLKTNVVDRNASYLTADSSTVFSNLCTFSFSSVSDLKENFDSAVLNSIPAVLPGGSVVTNGWQSSGSSAVSAGSGFEELPGSTVDIVTSLELPSFSGQKAEYTDVSAEQWYWEPVSALGGSGILNGYPDGSFAPYEPIKRSEFAKMIVSAFSVSANKKSFRDVSPEAWYEPYVSVAAGAGMVNGDGENYYPDAYITRQDAAVILYRTAALSGVQYNGLERPSDLEDAFIYAWTAISSLYSNSIIQGTDGSRFMPRENITRAEAVKMLYTLILDMQSR